MSEREKEIMSKIKDALPSMSEYDKGYIVGLADGHRKEDEEKKDKE